jgi:hypothetical protein
MLPAFGGGGGLSRIEATRDQGQLEGWYRRRVQQSLFDAGFHWQRATIMQEHHKDEHIVLLP